MGVLFVSRCRHRGGRSAATSSTRPRTGLRGEMPVRKQPSGGVRARQGWRRVSLTDLGRWSSTGGWFGGGQESHAPYLAPRDVTAHRRAERTTRPSLWMLDGFALHGSRPQSGQVNYRWRSIRLESPAWTRDRRRQDGSMCCRVWSRPRSRPTVTRGAHRRAGLIRAYDRELDKHFALPHSARHPASSRAFADAPGKRADEGAGTAGAAQPGRRWVGGRLAGGVAHD